MLGLLLCLAVPAAAQDVPPDPTAGMQAAAARQALIEALAHRPEETLREMGIPDLVRDPNARIQVGPDPDQTISLDQHLRELILGVARSAGPRAALGVAGALAEIEADALAHSRFVGGTGMVTGCLGLLGTEALQADLPPWERADYLASAATYMGLIPASLGLGEMLSPISSADLRRQALADYCAGVAAYCRQGDLEGACDLLECAYQAAPEQAEEALLATLQEGADKLGEGANLRQVMSLLLLVDRVSAGGGSSLQAGLSERAEQLAAAGQVAAGREALLQLVVEHERRQTRLGYQPALRQRWAKAMQEQYGLLLGGACAAGDSELALELSEYRRVRAFREQWRERCLEMPLRLPPPLQAERETLHGMRAQLAAALAPATSEGFQGATLGPYVPLRGDYLPLRQNAPPPMPGDVLRGLVEDIEEQHSQFEQALRAQLPAYGAAAAVEPRAAALLHALIAGSDGLLAIEYSVVRGRYVAVALTGQLGAVAKTLDAEEAAASAAAETGVAPIAPRGAPTEPPRAIAELVRDYRDAIAKGDAGAAEGLGRTLYDRLLAPFGDLLTDAKALLLVPDGSLGFLPFEALPMPDGVPLIERLPVAYAPSIATLGEGNGPGGAVAGTLLALGNVTYGPAPAATEPDADSPAPPAEGVAAGAEGAPSPLPGTQAEVKAAAQCFAEPVLLTGAEATRDAFVRLAGRFHVIHLATHAYPDAEYADYGGLVLAPTGEGDPALLRAFEVYGLPLNADLVVLSACEAGSGGALVGEGVTGLARSFLSAGAGEVLCSLWRAPDDAATQLLQSFYRHWTAGEPAAEALRAAQLQLRADPATASPRYWAGWTLIEGSGGRGFPTTSPGPA